MIKLKSFTVSFQNNRLSYNGIRRTIELKNIIANTAYEAELDCRKNYLKMNAQWSVSRIDEENI